MLSLAWSRACLALFLVYGLNVAGKKRINGSELKEGSRGTTQTGGAVTPLPTLDVAKFVFSHEALNAERLLHFPSRQLLNSTECLFPPMYFSLFMQILRNLDSSKDVLISRRPQRFFILYIFYCGYSFPSAAAHDRGTYQLICGRTATCFA